MDKFTPGQLARVLRLPEPTPEQTAVIEAPLGPLAVHPRVRPLRDLLLHSWEQ